MEKLKIGIIGCGGIANGKHMPALSRLNDVEMVAFCDIIEERAKKAAAQYGTPDAKVFTDYKELLKLDLDVVNVLTPNKQHSFITVDALESGKHVMCEKPMAINSAEAQKMLDAAAADGTSVIIATPHVKPGVRAFDREKYESGLAALNAYTAQMGYRLRILPGAEIKYTDATLRLLDEGGPFFSLKLRYEGEHLREAVLNGKHLQL